MTIETFPGAWTEDSTIQRARSIANWPYALIARDAHVLQLETTYAVDFFGNHQAPLIDESKIFFWKDLGGTIRLVGREAAVMDEDDPVYVTVVNLSTGWETQQVADAVGSFHVVIAGDPGDEVSLVATDSGDEPRSSEPVVVVVPEIEAVTVSFDADSYTVEETDGSIAVAVRRSGSSLGPASVRVQSVADGADAISDYEPVDEILFFEPGETLRTVVIPIYDDPNFEGDEAFRLDLVEPEWTELAAPATASVTIVDDEVATRTVAFSILVGGGNKISGPIEVSISDGVALFGDVYLPAPTAATGFSSTA